MSNSPPPPPTAFNSSLNTPQATYTIWQWNCRGVRRKKGLLTQYIKVADPKPDIILLQETNGSITIPGYELFTQPSITHKDKRSPTGVSVPIMTATYVSKHIAATQIDTSHLNTPSNEYVTVQCRLGHNTKDTIITNAYWLPKHPNANLGWLAKHSAGYKSHPVLIAGDFNSHSTSWGYKRTTSNGRKLAQAMEVHQYTLLNDTTLPTRTGNSVEHDSSPDLTWYNGPVPATWDNLQETLGSDHCILQTSLTYLQTRRKSSQGGLRTKMTKWDKLRTELDELPTPSSYQEWVDILHSTYRKHTKHIINTPDQEHVDSHLLSLWDKRHRMIQRWKKNKTNRPLKKAIQAITEEAQEYACTLTTENWLQTCDQLNGQLHTPRVWQILRSLLGQAKPRHTLTKLLMHAGADPESLARDIQKLFYPHKPNLSPLPDHPPESPDSLSTGINSPFSMNELQAALHNLKRNTTPGMDGITYTTLRNLPEHFLEPLLDQINQAWETGILPHEWKTALIIPIPKPGKPPNQINNLRPISLTSCVGKLMERMALNRLQWHLETTDSLAYTMTGFQSHVSTQDAMLRIY